MAKIIKNSLGKLLITLILGVIVVCGFLFLIIALYVPFFQTLLKTVPLGFFEWFVLLAFGLLNFALVEITKWYFIKKQNV